MEIRLRGIFDSNGKFGSEKFSENWMTQFFEKKSTAERKEIFDIFNEQKKWEHEIDFIANLFIAEIFLFTSFLHACACLYGLDILSPFLVPIFL